MTTMNAVVETFLPAPPGPPGVLRASELVGAQHDPLAFLLWLTHEYGDLVRYQTPYGTKYLINAPDMIAQVARSWEFPRGSLLTLVLGQGLLASEGPYWKKQRSLMLPEFHPRTIASSADTINVIAHEHLHRWRESSRRGDAVDLSTELLHLTLQVVVEALFSGDLHDEHETFYHAIRLLLADIGALVCSEFVAPITMSPERNRRVFQTIANLHEIVGAAITKRRKQDDKHDLLSLLLATRYENGEGLSDAEIRDEIMTMVFAGNDTTATALGWSSYVLATEPEIARQLQAEVDGVLQGRAATLDDLPNLPYLKMFLNESLRLYPPVWSIFRKTTVPQAMGDFWVEGRQTAVISPYTMHRHPHFWPEPERFDPHRFDEDKVAARPRQAFIPFGAGRHVCIGQRFALMEAQLVLAQLVQCFDLKLAPGARVEMDPLVTLRFKHGLPIVLEPRPLMTRVLGE
jgi:cytochrome P450